MAFPGTPVGIADLFNQRGQMVMLIARAATQRVDFLGQARVLVVFECQLVAVRQRQADDVAEVIQRNCVLFTAEVATSGHPAIGVVVNQRLATQHVCDAGGARLEVVVKIEMFAVTGPVLYHTRLAVDSFPAVFAGEPERGAVPRHNAIGVAEITQRVAVAITDLAQLAVVVIAISDQGFERLVTDDAFDLGKATEWVVVVRNSLTQT